MGDAGNLEQIPALAPTSCVTVGKSLGFSMPHFHTHKIGMIVVLAPILISCEDF